MRYLLIILVLCGAAFAQYPGQGGNPVGYAAWGNGTLSTASCPPFTSGTSGSPAVYSGKCSTAQTISGSYIICQQCDFQNGLSISGDHITIVGSRIQSNAVNSYQGTMTGTNIYLFYDSFVPLASFYTSPPGSTWPSAGAGANSTTMTSGTNSIPCADSYQYAVPTTTSGAGPIWMDHSDVWGFGNAIYFIAATTAQMTFTSNWVHDAAFNGSTCAYHTDGYGYLNGGAAPNNVLIAGNTVATLGNTHDIAMQQATSGYSNWIVAGNYLSGDQYAVAWCAPGTVHCTSSTFAFNVYGTDVMPEQGTVYSGGITLGTGSSWNCDTISFLAGTTWTDADGWTPTSGMNGQYWLPSTTPNSATDNGGNTICASPSTYSFDYQNQATSTTSSSKSVTITSFSSGNVTGLYASLVTGTQYAIVSNTCGTSGSPITLNSSSTCTVAVTFTPTSLGAKADTLNFTSTNSPAAISPTPVTLVGLGVTPTQASPSSCSPGSGTYSSTQHPACTNPNSGTTVQCYATGGTTPATNGLGTGCTTGTLLASGGTVTVAANVVLNIIAGTSTLADSPVNSYTYYIQASPATCSPTSGNVPQTVTCTNPNGGTTIACYKTTGNPATNGLGTACAVGSTAYTTSLSVTNPETLSIVAGTSTTIDSPVNSYTYGSVSNTAPAIGMFAQLELP